MNVDTEWFKSKIKKKFRSQRQFCRLMKGRNGKVFGTSNLCLLINGKREVLLTEIEQFSNLLDESIIEVIYRFGLKKIKNK